MNYPQVLQLGQFVYLKNELTNNEQVLCKVIGFVSQTGIYYVQKLHDISKGEFNGNVYSTGVEYLSLKKEK